MFLKFQMLKRISYKGFPVLHHESSISEKVFGEKHYQGYFDFVGFITSPQHSSVINEFHQKSLFECSSECLLNENCYIFDFCETGSSISCYFYHYDFASTSDVESGACRRYELVRAMLLHPYCIS